jgi:hypothetical protein
MKNLFPDNFGTQGRDRMMVTIIFTGSIAWRGKIND